MVYHKIQIGSQFWMVENLKVTKYNDGTAIPLVTDSTAWANQTTSGYCWYNNDAPTYKNTYGALYNWYTVNTFKVCPSGWHVPSSAEWKTLTTYVGGSFAGGKLKETSTVHWLSPNEGATNETGFTALPGGLRKTDRIANNGAFDEIGQTGYWWSSTETSPYAWLCTMSYAGTYVDVINLHQRHGFSVRCVKD